MNSNVLASMPKAEKAEVHTHLLHPVFLGGHFHSVFETKYINPVIHNRSLELLELKGENENQKQILKKLLQSVHGNVSGVFRLPSGNLRWSI